MTNIIPFPGTNANANANPGMAGAGGPATAAQGIGNNDPFWVPKRIWAIRHLKDASLDQKQRILFNFIWDYENSKVAGSMRLAWFRTHDSRAFLFNGARRRLYEIDHNNVEFNGYFFDTYGLNSSEQFTRHLVSMLKNATVSKGLMRDLRRFAFYDRRERKLYVSSYDGSAYCMTGDSGGVTAVANGMGPSVFIDDDRGSSPDEPLVGNNNALFTHLIDDLQYAPTTTGGMSPEIQKTCLGIWIFAVAFPDLMPTKPLLLVEGDRGSGKTLALQRIALALHGKNMPLQVSKQEDKDFGVKILRSPIAILDDVNEPVDWLRDMLCTYATGGGWTRRALFTNDSEFVIKPEAFLAITTNNPTTFRQSQVADRCLIIRLERREGRDGYIGAEALFEAVRQNRDEIFGDWLAWLNAIVAELRRTTKPTPSKSRMADFAHLAHVIGRVLARPGGPPGHWHPEAIEEMLAAMQAERNALVVEGDPLTDLIDKWLDTTSNQGREIKINDLHRELGNIARALGQTTFYKTPKALQARLREAGPALAEHVDISRRQLSGSYLYTIRRAD